MTTMSKQSHLIHIKEPGSALTHFIALIACIASAGPLLTRGVEHNAGLTAMICYVAFLVGATLLYTASTCYHTFDLSPRGNQMLKKFDHMMIPMLIAGTYTPASLLGLGGKAGIYLLIFVWTFAIGGMIMKLFWVNCPKWVSSVLYIGMGWSCVLAIPSLFRTLPLGGFLWLLIGGIFYTIGGVVYAFKFDLFRNRFSCFGTHEVFHLFIMAGTFCHYVFIYFYLT